MPRTCGTVACDSSTNSRKSSGKEIEQRVRRRARRPAAQRPAVVLDARAEADFQHHLDVEPRAGVEPLGFEQLALVLEHFAAALPAPA